MLLLYNGFIASLLAVSILFLLQNVQREIPRRLSEIDRAAELQSCFFSSSFVKGQQHRLHVACTGSESVLVVITIKKLSLELFMDPNF